MKCPRRSHLLYTASVLLLSFLRAVCYDLTCFRIKSHC
nr:MAG TPA: hypothetical protein [Caudoviricetes sp.]